MIMRHRVTGIRPGTLDRFREVARDWKNLLEENGGSVLGFYFDATENEIIGIAEYESREDLSEIQQKCEADPAYHGIMERAEEMTASFEERILDKLEIDS